MHKKETISYIYVSVANEWYNINTKLASKWNSTIGFTIHFFVQNNNNYLISEATFNSGSNMHYLDSISWELK